MATIAKILQNGSDLVTFNDGSTADLLEYFPNRPALTGADTYDLVTPVRDVLRVSVRGSTRDAVANNASLIEEKCNRIGRALGTYYDFVWRANNLTTQGTAALYAATLTRRSIILPDSTNVYRQTVEVSLTRSPVWQGPLTAITLDAATPAVIDNDDSNYVVFPALLGDLPAPTKLVFYMSGGNSANAKRLLAGLKIWDAANFQHLLQFESATYLDAALTNLSSTNYSPGTAGVTAKAWEPTTGNTTWRALARWDFTTNLADRMGTFLTLLRLSDNAAAPNYRFKVRGGDIVNASYLPGPWATAEKIRTPVSTTGATTEFLLMSLGTLSLPRFRGRSNPRDGVYVELYGEAGAASAGAVYLDSLALVPVRDAARAAEFEVGINADGAVFDSREGLPQAYLENGGDYLTGAALLPQGGGIFLYPRIAGQRLYFYVTRGESEYFKHRRDVVFTVEASYCPRYVAMPGTN